MGNKFGFDRQRILIRFLVNPSPTHLHPTHPDVLSTFVPSGWDPLGGRSPSLSWGSGLGWWGVWSRGRLGGLPGGERCLHDTVCQSDLLWLHYFLVIESTPPSHSPLYK